MTNEEAIMILKNEQPHCGEKLTFTESDRYEAYNMAIQALENIGHLTDRPCSACEFRKENGCCKWDCVFD